MAKRPLKEPDAPPGPQYDFFDLLQRLVRRHGDLPLSKIVKKGMYTSRQVLHRGLVGPDLPSRDFVSALVTVLECSEEEKAAALTAYEAANEDRIERNRRYRPRHPPGLPGATDSLQAPRPPDQAHTLQEFTERLSVLRKAAGNPSLRELERHINVRRSTLSDWFTGQSMPRDADSLAGLVRFLEASQEEGASMSESDIKSWIRAWEQVRRSERGP